MNIAIVLLAGCASPGLKNPAYPTGSSTIVAQGRSLYAVNAWDGTLTRTDWEDGIARELELGGEPTRIARVGDELWVTLRAERTVVILNTTDTLPEETERIRVGAEPYGIVATEDGSRVYVTVSQEDAVLEIDASSREVLRRFEVGNDPRWLALHPNETALFVVYGFVHPVTRIDLETGKQTEIEFPETYVPPPENDGAASSSGGAPDDGPIDLIPRNTGDPAISPRGDLLVVPTLYVDPSTPGDQPIVDGGNIQPPQVPYYVGSTGGGLQLSLSKFNPALVGIPLDPYEGEPLPDEEVLAFFVGGFTPRAVVRGYVGSATFDPNGYQVYATIEAADAVAVVDLRPADGQGMNAASPNLVDSGGVTAPSEGNFWERPQVFVDVVGNPSGVAIDGDGFRWVHERGNRRVSWFRTNKVMSLLDEVAEGKVFGLERLAPAGRFEAGTVRIDADVEAGRQLFYTANDTRMSAAGAGVSCATCHFEGRNDGLTWAFDSDPRQTPSLVGPVGLTAPVTWTDKVPTVADEAMITSVGRMGGQGVGAYEAAQIEAFIESHRDVDVKDKGRSDALVARGAELFASPAVGCLECHNGPRFTDNNTHRLFGIDVNTPGLVGIEATAPYFHDGSAATLRDVLLRVRDGSMGSTAGLSDEDLDALEAYLRTL